MLPRLQRKELRGQVLQRCALQRLLKELRSMTSKVEIAEPFGHSKRT
jgi:hypothetical protein